MNTWEVERHARFIYNAGRLWSVSHATVEDWHMIYLAARRLHRKYEDLCNGTLRTPTRYQGENADYDYLAALENTLERRIFTLLPGCQVEFNRDPRGAAVVITIEGITLCA
jgi:hypothetical protein